MHRNSPKRYHIPNAVYFVTSKTLDNYPFFRSPWVARFLIQEFHIARGILDFRMYAYVVMPDHFHARIQPRGEKTISDDMHFIKRHISRNIRIIASSAVDEDCLSSVVLRRRAILIYKTLGGRNHFTITLSAMTLICGIIFDTH